MIPSYVTNLTSSGLLSPSEESRLIRLAQSGDLHARNRIIMANMRLVIALAKNYIGGVELADLVQEGVFGLIKAIDKFNPTLGFRFSTYATTWIRHDLSRALDNKSRSIRLPAHINDTLRRISKAQEELKDKDKDPGEEELAAYLGMPVNRLHTLMSDIPSTISLEEPVGLTTPLGALLEDEGAGDPLNLVMEACDLDNIANILSLLTNLEKQVLLLKLEDCSYDDIHDRLQISRDRIKMLENSAIGKLADFARGSIDN